MKSYDLVKEDIHGEVHAVSYRYNSKWEVIGYDYYQNDNFRQFVPNVEFSINGANVTVKSLEDAVRIGKAIESLANEAETSFNNSHPELNP